MGNNVSSFNLVETLRNCCTTKVLEPEKSEASDEKPCVYGSSDHSHDSGETTVATVPSPSSTDSLVHSSSSNTSQNVDLDGSKSRSLHRTSPGTVFSPPFRHFKHMAKTPTGSKSFVEYFSRKISSTIFHSATKETDAMESREGSPAGTRRPTDWVRNFLLQDDSSERSSARPRANDQILLPHAKFSKPTAVKSYPITIASLFASKAGSTSTADFASVSAAATSDERAAGVEVVFTEKEEEYARKIDLFVRTRSTFDTRHPQSFAIKVNSLVRDFLHVETSSAFSSSEALAPSEIVALLHKHPRFRVSRDNKSVSLAYLTPYHREASSNRSNRGAEDDVMLYGYFLCSICKRRWESGVSWQDTWQRCRHCQAQVFPYDQHEPISREKLLAKLVARQLHSRSTSANTSNNTSTDTSNNPSNSSSSYNVLKNKSSAAEQSVDGSSDSPLGVVEGDTTDDGALPNNGGVDDEDNDDLAVDIFSLRDRIERHKKQWCQKCLALGHLCIPYRHYSL